MRTTLVIDDDLLAIVRRIAQAQSVSTGAALSGLARKGLENRMPMTLRNGLPVFEVPTDATPITLQHVQRAEDDA